MEDSVLSSMKTLLPFKAVKKQLWLGHLYHEIDPWPCSIQALLPRDMQGRVEFPGCHSKAKNRNPRVFA